MCKIADVVVVGGVRRSALISLSDADDERLRTAKTGAWWVDAGHRALANNSAVYTTKKPDIGFFMKEWKALYDSKSGERGFFSRYAAKNIAGRNGRRDTNHDFGCNPCLSN
jgi:ribonucleoside-diphosphate reductase alpha chain